MGWLADQAGGVQRAQLAARKVARHLPSDRVDIVLQCPPASSPCTFYMNETLVLLPEDSGTSWGSLLICEQFSLLHIYMRATFYPEPQPSVMKTLH